MSRPSVLASQPAPTDPAPGTGSPAQSGRSSNPAERPRLRPLSPLPEPLTRARPRLSSRPAVDAALARYELAGPEPAVAGPTVVLVGTTSACAERFSLGAGEFTVGRAPDCDVVLDHEEVSRRHATLLVTRGQVVVRDGGSSNGTFVNGRRVAEETLRDGDVLHLGVPFRFSVMLRHPGATDATPPGGRQPSVIRSSHRDPGDTTDQESRQLAMLLQVATRMLEERSRRAPTQVLFELLPRLVVFRTAAVFVRKTGRIAVRLHPDSVPLSDGDLHVLLGSCGDTAVACDQPGQELRLSQLTVASRAIVPLRGGWLCLLSDEPGAYRGVLDFLTILGHVYDAARRGAHGPAPVRHDQASAASSRSPRRGNSS